MQVGELCAAPGTELTLGGAVPPSKAPYVKASEYRKMKTGLMVNTDSGEYSQKRWDEALQGGYVSCSATGA